MKPFTDHVEPKVKWEFDEEVARCFDDMLERSIPQYEVMRRAVTSLALQHFWDSTDVVDLGCSRGEALEPLVRQIGRRASSFVGVEVSDPMLEAARARFFAEELAGLVSIQSLDLRCAYPVAQASVTLCVLTLQFTPIEHRLRIVRDAWKATRSGGALILVEKVIGASADLDTKMVENYYALKSANGYSREQIDRKRLSLEGVLVPVTHDWNVDLLRRAGFAEVDCFWAWMNFRGFVAVKA
jgi:tRNA (cmo5U34)-methyltransferase